MESDQSPLAMYLDAVEAVLLEQKVSRLERATILGELESQIFSMASAKVEEGGTVSDELIASVIESMDSPESYRQVNDQAVGQSTFESSNSARNNEASERSRSEETMRSSTFSIYQKKIQEYLDSPRTDEFAIVSCGLLALSIVVGLANRFHDGLFLAGCILFVACCLGCVSIYRIKRSEGKLWGGRLAFLGAIAFPALLLNIFVITVSLGTPVGLLLLAAAVAYVNYRLLLRVWNWIACARLRHKPLASLESPMPVSHSAALS